MKNTTQQEAENIRALFDELSEKFSELRDAIRNKLDPHERDSFKYNCLGHCEPGLFEDTEWYTKYSSIKPLEHYVKCIEDAVEEDGDDTLEEPC